MLGLKWLQSRLTQRRQDGAKSDASKRLQSIAAFRINEGLTSWPLSPIYPSFRAALSLAADGIIGGTALARRVGSPQYDGQTDDAVRRFQGRMRALDSYAPSVKEGWFDARLVSPVARIRILDRTGTALRC